MPIITVSLDVETLEELKKVEREFLHATRSEVIRAAIWTLAQNYNTIQTARGEIAAVLLITHRENAEKTISALAHDFSDVVETHLHTNVRKGKCLEVFILRGDASRIEKLYTHVHAHHTIAHVHLIVL